MELYPHFGLRILSDPLMLFIPRIGALSAPDATLIVKVGSSQSFSKGPVPWLRGCLHVLAFLGDLYDR